jgi:hypothetical protein
MIHYTIQILCILALSTAPGEHSSLQNAYDSVFSLSNAQRTFLLERSSNDMGFHWLLVGQVMITEPYWEPHQAVQFQTSAIELTGFNRRLTRAEDDIWIAAQKSWITTGPRFGSQDSP